MNMNNTNESLNRNPFTVPEGYFDQLEADVRRKTETDRKSTRLNSSHT